MEDNGIVEERDIKRKNTHIDDCLIKFITCTNQAIAIVDNIYFANLVEALNKTYKIPCRQTCTKKIVLLRKQVETEIKLELSKVSACSVTCDNWTSIAKQSYLGVTTHFINEYWQLCSRVLRLKYMPESHTGPILKARLFDIFEYWNIKEKVKYITSDSGANIKNAITTMIGQLFVVLYIWMLYNTFEKLVIYILEISHIPCCGHVINLAVGDFLKIESDDNQPLNCIVSLKSSFFLFTVQLQ